MNSAAGRNGDSDVPCRPILGIFEALCGGVSVNEIPAEVGSSELLDSPTV